VQDEVTAEESKSGLPMFGDTFPTRAWHGEDSDEDLRPVRHLVAVA
jgi:hypothetical protein